MEKDPKLPRICAFLTLWLQRKHRAKPCRLQLPAPGQLPSPVSTAASSLCRACGSSEWASALGGCSEQSGLLLFLWDSLFNGALEETSLGASKACLCWVGHRGWESCSPDPYLMNSKFLDESLGGNLPPVSEMPHGISKLFSENCQQCLC